MKKYKLLTLAMIFLFCNPINSIASSISCPVFFSSPISTDVNVVTPPEPLPYTFAGVTYTKVLAFGTFLGTNYSFTHFYYFDNATTFIPYPDRDFDYAITHGNVLEISRYTNYGNINCNQGDSLNYLWGASAYVSDPIASQYYESIYLPTSNLTISIKPLEGGNITGMPGVLSCTNGTCTSTFSGSETLTANAADGWTFSYWTDGTNDYSDNPHTFTVNSNVTVKAVFRLLSFPLAGYTPYTAPVSAVFDHSATGWYALDNDNHVTAFDGESSDDATYYPETTCYAKDSNHNSAFGFGFNYTGVTSLGGVNYLCYNGHPGFDYAVSCNTAVYAATNGIAHIPTSFPGYLSAQDYNTIEVDHGDGYKTYYLHLNSQNLTDGQPVCAGDLIGYSGNVGTTGCHLHFEVQKDNIPIDPYGWTGSGADPYTRAVNINLWK